MHILIDTCDWLELGKSLHKLRRNIITLVENGDIVIVLPEIVEREWQRHKEDKVIKSKRSRLKTIVSHTKEVIELLPEDTKQSFLDAISNMLVDKVQEYSEQDASEIDALFANSAVVRIHASETTKALAADLALEKKAPFKSKNSMADALIFLSFIEFVRENNIPSACFISNNTSDFADKTNNQIHPDLEQLIDDLEIRYFSNIGEAINAIKEGIVSNEEVEFVERINQFDAFAESLLASARESVLTESLLASIREFPMSQALESLLASARESVLTESPIDSFRETPMSPALAELLLASTREVQEDSNSILSSSADDNKDDTVNEDEIDN